MYFFSLGTAAAAASITVITEQYLRGAFHLVGAILTLTQCINVMVLALLLMPLLLLPLTSLPNGFHYTTVKCRCVPEHTFVPVSQ